MRRFFGGLAVLALVCGVAVAKSGVRNDSVAVPTLTEFQVTLDTESLSSRSKKMEKKSEQYHVQVFDLPLEQDHKEIFELDKKTVGRVAVVVINGPELGENLPLGVIIVVKDDTSVDLQHPTGQLLSRAIVPLFTDAVPRDRIAQLGSGEEKIACPALAIDGVPVKYKSAEFEDDENKWMYTVDLVSSPYEGYTGTVRTSVGKLSRRFVIDRKTGRIIDGKWSFVWKRSFSSGKTRNHRESVTLAEKSHRILKNSEVTKINKELELLEPISRALVPSAFNSLRGKNGSAELKKLKKALAAYKKRYSSGLLAAALPKIDSGFEAVIAQLNLPEDPEEAARLMVNKKAPDFKLKTVDGKTVTLSALKGKVVLLNFWAVL